MKTYTAQARFTYKNSLVSHKLRIQKNSSGEYGVFAKEAIEKNEIVCMLMGKIMHMDTFKKLTPNLKRYALQIDDNHFSGIDTEEDFDAGEYFNHSCNPNLGVVGNNVLVAMRAIQKGEELCFDYAMSETTDEDMNWDCHCGEKLCRGRVTPTDYLLPQLQKRYKGYLSRYIEKKIEEKKA